jgi:hypothetical protein
VNKIILPALMTMEYVRVRHSTRKEIEELLRQRRSNEWHVVAAIVGMVLIVAVAGLALAL